MKVGDRVFVRAVDWIGESSERAKVVLTVVEIWPADGTRPARVSVRSGSGVVVGALRADQFELAEPSAASTAR